MALLSPVKAEVSWALSRLIHASYSHAERLVLSQWCGLAQRLLELVQRFNSAARHQGPLGWDEYEEHARRTGGPHLDDGSDDESDPEEDDDVAGTIATKGSTSTSSKHPPSFDARIHDDHYFTLNAAVTASLILRNACEQQDNAVWLAGQPELLKIAYEAISLPEDLFGFESNVVRGSDNAATFHNEEEMRFEGVREMRLYWMEILRSVAHRMKLFNPTDVVRLDDGTATRSASVSAQTMDAITSSIYAAEAAATPADGNGSASQGADAAGEPPILPLSWFPMPSSSRVHSSDQIFSHAVLLLHSTADQALLLAVLRFLAQLISNARARPDLFIERDVRVEGLGKGCSPGIVARCRELLPLSSWSHPLAEAILDCLDAAVDVALCTSPAEQISGDAEEGMWQMRTHRTYPNALSVVALRSGGSSGGGGDASADSSSTIAQPAVTLLSHFLSLSATFWERKEPLKLHSALHPPSIIPSQQRHRQESFARVPWYREEDVKWHRLRANKEQSGLVDHATTREKQQIEALEEPARLDAWLRLVTRTVGDGHRQDNNHYVTQMHIWTSYRDTFDPLVKRAATENRTLPPLMAAADVISRVTEVFTSTSAVLVIDEDRRQPPNTQKFVIRGLEGYRRPEVIRWNCRWRGCPAPKTDSKEALMQHITLHVQHAKDATRCGWSTCKARVRGAEEQESGKLREYLVDHIKTHLPKDGSDGDEGQEEQQAAAATKKDEPAAADVKQEAPRALSPPPHGRFVPVKPLHKTPREGGDVDGGIVAEQSPHAHAKSAPQPSRYTYDRPSSISYNVFRTPFDQERKVPEGPAYSSARILKRIATMCREVLGEDDGSTEFAEDDGDDDDEDGGDADGAIALRNKRSKLDFSDRLEQNRFGSPFYLPPNFAEDHAKALKAAAARVVAANNGTNGGTTAQQTPGAASAAAADTPMVETTAATPTPGSNTPQPSAQSLAKQRSIQALQDLLAIEDNLVRWAGSNDILCQTLMETLDLVHRTRGVRIGSAKKKRKGGGGEGQGQRAVRE